MAISTSATADESKGPQQREVVCFLLGNVPHALASGFAEGVKWEMDAEHAVAKLKIMVAVDDTMVSMQLIRVKDGETQIFRLPAPDSVLHFVSVRGGQDAAPNQQGAAAVVRRVANAVVCAPDAPVILATWDAHEAHHADAIEMHESLIRQMDWRPLVHCSWRWDDRFQPAVIEALRCGIAKQKTVKLYGPEPARPPAAFPEPEPQRVPRKNRRLLQRGLVGSKVAEAQHLREHREWVERKNQFLERRHEWSMWHQQFTHYYMSACKRVRRPSGTNINFRAAAVAPVAAPAPVLAHGRAQGRQIRGPLSESTHTIGGNRRSRSSAVQGRQTEGMLQFLVASALEVRDALPVLARRVGTATTAASTAAGATNAGDAEPVLPRCYNKVLELLEEDNRVASGLGPGAPPPPAAESTENHGRQTIAKDGDDEDDDDTKLVHPLQGIDDMLHTLGERVAGMNVAKARTALFRAHNAFLASRSRLHKFVQAALEKGPSDDEEADRDDDEQTSRLSRLIRERDRLSRLIQERDAASAALGALLDGDTNDTEANPSDVNVILQTDMLQVNALLTRTAEAAQTWTDNCKAVQQWWGGIDSRRHRRDVQDSHSAAGIMASAVAQRVEHKQRETEIAQRSAAGKQQQKEQSATKGDTRVEDESGQDAKSGSQDDTQRNKEGEEHENEDDDGEDEDEADEDEEDEELNAVPLAILLAQHADAVRSTFAQAFQAHRQWRVAFPTDKLIALARTRRRALAKLSETISTTVERLIYDEMDEATAGMSLQQAGLGTLMTLRDEAAECRVFQPLHHAPVDHVLQACHVAMQAFAAREAHLVSCIRLWYDAVRIRNEWLSCGTAQIRAITRAQAEAFVQTHTALAISATADPRHDDEAVAERDRRRRNLAHMHAHVFRTVSHVAQELLLTVSGLAAALFVADDVNRYLATEGVFHDSDWTLDSAYRGEPELIDARVHPSASSLNRTRLFKCRRWAAGNQRAVRDAQKSSDDEATLVAVREEGEFVLLTKREKGDARRWRTWQQQLAVLHQLGVVDVQHVFATANEFFVESAFSTQTLADIVLEHQQASHSDGSETASATEEVGRRKRLAVSILLQLVQLHARAVVHSNIKPENIFVAQSSGDTAELGGFDACWEDGPLLPASARRFSAPEVTALIERRSVAMSSMEGDAMLADAKAALQMSAATPPPPPHSATAAAPAAITASTAGAGAATAAPMAPPLRDTAAGESMLDEPKEKFVNTLADMYSFGVLLQDLFAGLVESLQPGEHGAWHKLVEQLTSADRWQRPRAADVLCNPFFTSVWSVEQAEDEAVFRGRKQQAKREKQELVSLEATLQVVDDTRASVADLLNARRTLLLKHEGGSDTVYIDALQEEHVRQKRALGPLWMMDQAPDEQFSTLVRELIVSEDRCPRFPILVPEGPLITTCVQATTAPHLLFRKPFRLLFACPVSGLAAGSGADARGYMVSVENAQNWVVRLTPLLQRTVRLLRAFGSKCAQEPLADAQRSVIAAAAVASSSSSDDAEAGAESQTGGAGDNDHDDKADDEDEENDDNTCDAALFKILRQVDAALLHHASDIPAHTGLVRVQASPRQAQVHRQTLWVHPTVQEDFERRGRDMLRDADSVRMPGNV